MSLQVGDVVKVTRTVKLDSVDRFGEFLARDVQNDDPRFLNPNETGSSLKIEMVKKAAPKARKRPAVGALVAGRDVKKIMWKRGTVIRVNLPSTFNVSQLMLNAEGLWVDVNDNKFTFDDLVDDVKFEVKYLP